MDAELGQKSDYFGAATARVGQFAFAEQLSYIMMADAYHKAHDIRGAVGEIGVFLGDYLFGLGACARPDEPIVAIDLFDDQSANVDGSGAHDKGVTYFEAMHRDVIRNNAPLKCVKADSLYLTRSDLQKASDGRLFRLASIDGGHEHYHLTNDLVLVESVLTYGGVVIIDDYTNAGWPGVAEGVARYFLLSNVRKLVPFFSHWNKLLLTTESHHRELLNWYVSHCQRHGYTTKIKTLFGYDILHAQGFSQSLF